jgi:hypothetical protein
MSEGYGRDLRCWDGINTGRFAQGVDLVVQALYRRLTTSRGTLRGSAEAEAFGFDIAAYLGDVGIELALVSMPSLIQAELLKDDRVLEIVVLVAETEPGVLEVSISGALANAGETFALTLAVDEVSVAILTGGS